MYPRPVNEWEKKMLVRGLSSLRDAGPYLGQIDSLQVVDKCGCGSPGCHTVKFHHYRKGYSYAVAHARTDDGRDIIIFADEETGWLTELEII
jgi:hypothetical protein